MTTSPKSGCLEVRSLTRAVRWGGEIRVLIRDVSFDVPAGGGFGLTGPSGSGKTTVLRCIMGLDDRSDGTVSWNGVLVEDSGLPGFRRRVAFLPQQPFGGEGPLMAPEGDRERFRGYLGDLGLGDSALVTPANGLSGGELRRARLALLASRQPATLVLDEPYAGLDRDQRRLVADFLVNRRREGTSLVVTGHDEDFLAACVDHVAILYDGEVVGVGSVREMLPGAAARQVGRW